MVEILHDQNDTLNTATQAFTAENAENLGIRFLGGLGVLGGAEFECL
jgi:hypothetical protein